MPDLGTISWPGCDAICCSFSPGSSRPRRAPQPTTRPQRSHPLPQMTSPHELGPSHNRRTAQRRTAVGVLSHRLEKGKIEQCHRTP